MNKTLKNIDDKYYMQIALKEAKKSFKKNEVPIGAIIVDKKRKIIAKAHNEVIKKLDVSAHAEILAIRKASKKIGNYRLLDTTIYTTIEPCIMCIGAIIHARIKRIVFGAFDEKWGYCSIYNFPKGINHKVEIVSGVLQSESKKIMQNFFKLKR